MLPKSNLIGFAPFNVTENTKYLILGSFPSVKSLEGDFYYLHPQNKFYKLIANFFNEDYPQTISDKKNVLISHTLVPGHGAVYTTFAQKAKKRFNATNFAYCTRMWYNNQ